MTRRQVQKLLSMYGLTPEQFWAMWDKQGGLCGNRWCLDPLRLRKGGYTVDHDHRCPAPHARNHGCALCVRGLLCHNCNTTISAVESGKHIGMGWYIAEHRKPWSYDPVVQLDRTSASEAVNLGSSPSGVTILTRV